LELISLSLVKTFGLLFVLSPEKKNIFIPGPLLCYSQDSKLQ